MTRIRIEKVVEVVVEALFSNEVLSAELYLKGGQALRLKEGLLARFSADVDFSTPGALDSTDTFFEAMRKALQEAFQALDLHVFDFKFNKRPKVRPNGVPEFWSGWAVEFKLIHMSKQGLAASEQSRIAIVPLGSNSPRVSIDISEHEFCGSHEELKINGIGVKVYSRSLLLLEKIRAFCQQHPDYPHKESDQRARDLYDIERIWNKALREDTHMQLIEGSKKYLVPVFRAKDVDVCLTEKIFEPSFLELQKAGWPSVEGTVEGELENFEYYVESLKLVLNEIKK